MAGEASSSRLSKLPLKRRFEYLESKPLPLDVSDYWDAIELDNPIPQAPLYGTAVEVPDPKQVPVEEDPPEKKHKKSKKQIDKDHRLKKKAQNQELQNHAEKLKMEMTKREVLLEESKAQNAVLLAALESSKSDLAKVEKNLAHTKLYEGMRKKAMARLHNLIEKDVGSNNSGKEELWAQFYNPNGKQIFEKYWEENEKTKHEFRTIVELFLDLPHEEEY